MKASSASRLGAGLTGDEPAWAGETMASWFSGCASSVV